MADLLQIVQSGDQYDDTITWDDDTSEYLVPASNRTRILDREASRGIHPGEDGWLTYSRHVGQIRIRWQDYSAAETAVQDLDREK